MTRSNGGWVYTSIHEYCTPNAIWRLGWFLRDFLYDPELLSQDEVDERALRGLIGVVKITHTQADRADL